MGLAAKCRSLARPKPFQTMTQMATLPYCWTAPRITSGRGRTLVPPIFPNQRQISYSKSLYRLGCPLLGRRYVHLRSSTSNAAAGESSLQDDFEESRHELKACEAGLAAIPAYGLFDGVTRRALGETPRRTSKHFLGLSPFRVAGAAALAPMIDNSLKRIQKYFNFPSLVYAFALVVTVVAFLCLTIVGLLVLSRWKDSFALIMFQKLIISQDV